MFAPRPDRPRRDCDTGDGGIDVGEPCEIYGTNTVVAGGMPLVELGSRPMVRGSRSALGLVRPDYVTSVTAGGRGRGRI